MNVDLEKLRFPIGRYQKPVELDHKLILSSIKTLDDLAQKLNSACAGLSDVQLDTPYRENGWSIRQVIHHLADSHMNGYVRMKLALTEENPTIKPYDQDLWAQQYDSTHSPIESSLKIIESLHDRWAFLLRSLAPEDFTRTFHHPETKQNQSIGLWVSIYAWHCDHHLSHITSLKSRMGW